MEMIKGISGATLFRHYVRSCLIVEVDKRIARINICYEEFNE